jgi:hypothetical protein
MEYLRAARRTSHIHWVHFSNSIRLAATASRSRRWFSARFAINIPLSEIRGRRECRALDAPQPRVQMKKAHEHSHHGHTGITRHSPRNGFTAYFALSPAIGLVCHRRLARLLARLDAGVEASEPHDFTVRKSAPSSLAPPASTASR